MLLTEISKTIEVLESSLPANPASERNERIAKRLQRSLSDYFKNLDQAIDIAELERIYYRNVKE